MEEKIFWQKMKELFKDLPIEHTEGGHEWIGTTKPVVIRRMF